MKKGLLLIGALVLSTSVFAASAHDSVEGVVEVKAKVVQPLDIETSPVDYGIMVPGENKWADKTGTIKITGTAGERVKMEIKASGETDYTLYKGLNDTRNVELTTGSGTAENEKMRTSMSITAQGYEIGDDLSNGILVLEGTETQEGVKDFIVNGVLRAAQNQKSGDYTGQIHVRAMYE